MAGTGGHTRIGQACPLEPTGGCCTSRGFPHHLETSWSVSGVPVPAPVNCSRSAKGQGEAGASPCAQLRSVSGPVPRPAQSSAEGRQMGWISPLQPGKEKPPALSSLGAFPGPCEVTTSPAAWAPVPPQHGSLPRTVLLGSLAVAWLVGLSQGSGD